MPDDLSRPRQALAVALEQGADVAGRASAEAPVGDAACWLDRVCAECGRLAEAAASNCPRCGHSLG